MFRLITNSLLRRRWQSLATMFGVALGAAVLLSVFLLYRGLSRGLEVGRQRLGADLLVVPSNATVDPDKALFAGSPLSVYMDKSLADKARTLQGVRRVEAQFFTQTLRLECCSMDQETRLIGIEADVAKKLSKMSPKGRERLDPNEIILGSQLLNGLAYPGARMELLGDVFRVAYQLEPSGTSLDSSILMPIESARDLAAKSEGLKDVWQEAGDPHNLVSALLVEVTESHRVLEVSHELETLGSVRVIKAADTFQRLKRLLGAFVFVLAAAGVLTALGGVAYLLGHFSSVAWDRKGEWALFRALGATRPRVVQLVVGESTTLAVLGAAFGVPAGYGLYRLAFHWLSAENAFPFVPPAAFEIAAGAVGALAIYAAFGFLAAAAPALRIADLEPAITMAQGDID